MTHSDRQAAGFCSRCQMPYCSDCLDVEMGQPLCKVCKSKFSQAAPVAPAAAPAGGVSPLNFKNKGLDDDPLGLFGGGPTSAPAPKLEPPKAAPLSRAPGIPPPLPSPGVKPPTPASAPSPASPINLDSLFGGEAPPTLKPTFSKAPPLGAPSLAPGISPPPLLIDSVKGMAAGAPQKNKVLSLSKIWAKYLVRRSYKIFEPLARKLHVPTYVFLALLASLIFAAVVGIGTALNQPSVALVDFLPPIHFIQVNPGQVSEMDVTAYADLQSQLQGMGFTPLIQMTVPQLPSPNFFDVGIKEDIGTYSEILKMPGQITPHLSFVTVFTNGIWFSTNGWPGDNKTGTYRISEFYPQAPPDQLYVKHVQAVEKLKQAKDYQVWGMNENRYLAALSDHLRWFLVKKDIPGYKAEFALWH